MQSGLTNLKEKADVAPDSVLVPATHRVRTHLAELEGEIRTLKSQKESLNTDIKNLQITYSGQKNTFNNDIERFKEKRRVLVGMVKKLEPKVIQLESMIKGYSSGFEKFGEQRTQALYDIAKLIARETGLKEKDLSKQLFSLDALHSLLDEMAVYYENLAEIVEATAAQNQRRQASLDERGGVLSEDQKTTKRLKRAAVKSFKKASGHEEGARAKYVEAERELQKASDVLKDSVKERDRVVRALKRRGQSLESKERILDKKAEKLNNKETKLNDREGQLKRLAIELKKSA